MTPLENCFLALKLSSSYLDEGRHTVGTTPVHAVQHQAMQMYVEIGG